MENGTNKYRWISGWDRDDMNDMYEVLIRPDGTELAFLTEPEDRCSYRDLSPITEELNKLYNNQKENN